MHQSDYRRPKQRHRRRCSRRFCNRPRFVSGGECNNPREGKDLSLQDNPNEDTLSLTRKHERVGVRSTVRRLLLGFYSILPP